MTDRPPRRFAYRTPPELKGGRATQAPVAIVGAGPVGLALAIDLALRGIACTVLDDNDCVASGSRAICWSKRTLEIFDRLGVGARMVEKGVTWKVGRLYRGEHEIYAFDLLPEGGHLMPAFVNLQQYYVEEYLVERAGDFPDLIDLRWRNRVTGVTPGGTGVRLAVETPDGAYALDAAYAVACDGARSAVRHFLGLDFAGRGFDERFLIVDVEMQADFPAERRFWFDPPFHDGGSALLHKQPDDIWRIDLQLGPDADIEAEKRPERILPRVKAVFGARPFRLVWASVYTFQCRRLSRFVHGRVIFAGDSAHLVSPFGARGGNGGIQDADNLAWKLALLLKGEAPAALIETYDLERSAAADENIAHSTRSTDFIAPRSAQEKRFRDAALALARSTDFAKRMVNSGRLSTPTAYETPLSTPDRDSWAGSLRLGAPVPDAPVLDAEGRPAWLLDLVGGEETLLHVPNGSPPPAPARSRLLVLGQDLQDRDGFVAGRFDATPGATYLIRPDQHLAARWRAFDPEAVAAASRRLKGFGD